MEKQKNYWIKQVSVNMANIAEFSSEKVFKIHIMFDAKGKHQEKTCVGIK